MTDVALLGANILTIALGDGGGGFTVLPSINAGLDPTGLSITDVDRDGRLDLLVGNDFGDVLVILGNGDGTFRPFATADRGVALAVADLDGDGRDDFVFASQVQDRVVVEFGGAGTTVVDGLSRGPLYPGAVTLHDLTGDDRLDLIVADSGSNRVLIYPGLPDGRFDRALNGGNGFFAGTNPVAITVADVNVDVEGQGDGIPDLVVANRGSNDVSVLVGEGRGTSYTLVLRTRLRVGTGPVATVVQDVDGDRLPDVVASNSVSNDVRIVPAVGLGNFDDVNRARTIPVGNTPGPVFAGNFDNNPGTDLVTLNRGSNDLTLIPDFGGGTGIPQSIPSGGLAPVAGLGIDFSGDGVFDGLVVANNGDGPLALFLGGDTGLDLSQILTSPALPHPTALAFDSVSSGLLSFYASTEGLEAATLLAFALGGGNGSGLPPGPDSGSPVTPAPGAVMLLPQLEPLRESALALVATLLTVALNMDMPTNETGTAAALGTFSTTATAAPTQGVTDPEDPGGAADQADAAEEPPADAPEVPQPEQVPDWIRFISGLDESFDRHRRASLADLPTGAAPPSIAARLRAALDAVLARLTQDSHADRPGLAEPLRQAAGPLTRALDAAIDLLWSPEAPPAPPPAPTLEPVGSAQPEGAIPAHPALTEPEEVSSLSVSLSLVTALLVRRAWPTRRRRTRRIGLAGGRP